MKKFKEWWKGLSYWKKGGIIGASIPIILFLVTLILPRPFQIVGYAIGISFIFLNYWLGRPISHFTNCLGENCWGYWFYVSFIFSIFEFFLIGALISLLIKRLKNE